MPVLRQDPRERLAAALADRGAALASGEGQVHPLCGLWRTQALARMDSCAATGRRSLIGFAETVGFEAVEREGSGFLNVNTEQIWLRPNEGWA